MDNLLNPKNINSGIGQKALIALVNWFAVNGIKKPTIYETAITEKHLLIAGKEFIEVYLADDKNSYEAKSIGEKGGQKFGIEAKIVVPGSYKEVHELAKNLMNIPLIVLLPDVDCEDKFYYQIGTEDVPAYISFDFSTGTTIEGIKGYQAIVHSTNCSVLTYAPTVINTAQLYSEEYNPTEYLTTP